MYQEKNNQENLGATAITFTPNELRELNASMAAIHIQGDRLPLGIFQLSDVEAPLKLCTPLTAGFPMRAHPPPWRRAVAQQTDDARVYLGGVCN